MKSTFAILWAIAQKDLRHLARDKAAAFFTCVFPILTALFFGTIFNPGGGSRKIDVGVVDLAKGPASTAFIDRLRADGSLKLLELETLQAGEAAVRTKKVAACIVMPQDFRNLVSGLFSGTPMTLEMIAPPGGAPTVGLLTGKLNELAFRDLSEGFGSRERLRELVAQGREVIASSKDLNDDQRGALSTIIEGVGALSSGELEDTGTGVESGSDSRPGSGGFQPVKIATRELAANVNRPTNAYEVSFPQGVVWALMGCVVTFGISVVSERSRGTLTRLTLSPISKFQILAGKALACFLASMFVQAVLLAIGIAIFGVTVTSWSFMGLAVVVSGLGMTGLMMMIAGLSRTVASAEGYGRAIMLILAMIGGGSIPVAFMPPLMKSLSGVSPFSWVVNAFEGAMWASYSWAEMAVPLAVLMGVAIVGFAVGVWLFKWQE